MKQMKRMNLAVVALCAQLFACSDTIEPDPIDEPELSNEEQAALPDVDADDREHATLVEGAPEDDAALFDDDEAELVYDVEVIDNDESGSTVVPYAALLKWGLHPRASDGLRASGVAAWRITQTIGNATASAGVHKQDGTVNGAPYTAAVDISTSGMTATQIHNLLEKLAKVGFAVWYRKSGSDGWSGANHLHAVYANCKMKSALRSQVRSWLVGRNGLVSNTIYKWHTFSAAAKNAVKAKFAQSASGTTNGGAGAGARINTSGAALTIRASASTTAAAIGSVADGAYVTIKCQTYGQAVTGTYGTSKLWDKIGTGYVADAYVATGSDGRVAPLCP
jgi:hypothetical protein